MKNVIIALIIMSVTTPALAFYSRGQIYKDIYYDDFKINLDTGVVNFTIINKNSKKVTIFVKAQFCDIFNKYSKEIYVQKTIAPYSKKYIKERLYGNIKKASNAHHINWYIRYYKVGEKVVIINRLGDID